MLLAPVAQLRLGQLLVRVAIRLPQLEDADEFRLRIGELRVRGVGGAARVGRALARILDAEEARRSTSISRSTPCACAATSMRASFTSTGSRDIVRPIGGELALACVDRAEFAQLLPAVGDRARIRRIEERELLDAAQAQRQHAQDHAGQRGAADFRIGVARPRQEIGFGIQADADARARRGRNGPCAGWRWPAMTGSMCRRSSFCRGL